jgi:hypothetical protein
MEPAVSAVYWGVHEVVNVPPGTAVSSAFRRSVHIRRVCTVSPARRPGTRSRYSEQFTAGIRQKALFLNYITPLQG